LPVEDYAKFFIKLRKLFSIAAQLLFLIVV